MGQQQLLLVILVTIIVGVATVVAINIFGTSADNANVDAIRQDVLTISAMAQGYYIKPGLMDGGGGSFADLTVDNLGIGYDSEFALAADGTPDGTGFSNANGDYTITGAGPDEVTITGTSRNSGKRVQAVVYPNEIFSLNVLDPVE